MKFNVVITNPPYQLKDGGHGASAQPIYHKFVERAKNMADHVVMIIPARWYAGGKGLDEFRASMLADTRIRTLVDMPNSEDAFPGIRTAGGICYFHWDRNHDDLCNFVQWKDGNTNPKKDGSLRKLNVHDILIRDPKAVTILDKVLGKAKRFLEDTVSSRKPFGLRTNFDDYTDEGTNAHRCLTKDGFRYVNKSAITTGKDMVGRWKSICSRAHGEDAANSDGKWTILSKSLVLGKNEVCLETYLVTGAYETKTEAENAARYLVLKLPRYLLGLRKIDQNISKEKFKWVPIMDFTRTWTDEQIYAYFDLTAEEINTIESSIK